MNKFYLIDKPLNISSFDIIRVLRKKLNVRKIGHTGTLDPLATGGVILATGNYTKLIPYLEADKKTYEFTINLDGVTESFDLGEEVKFLSNDLQKKYKKELNIEKIKDILNSNFLGKIIQIPPKYSALKIDGRRAYNLARAGVDIKMKAREINIFNIEVLNFNYPKLELKAEVSAGTYIRSIAMDLGQILETGGYISKLRRTKIENLNINLGQNLDNFDENKFLDIKELFFNKNFISLELGILEKINNGLKVKGDFDFPLNENLFVINNNDITNIVFYDGKFLIVKKNI